MIASTFGLERVKFLYGQFLQFASIAIIVVFQPELRRALMRLGETRLFRVWSNQLQDEIDALVEAATFLSRRKIGALIAIEREVGLGGIAENGTRLNADLTAPLLNTIFWPNSPLHDLGVVISQGKIAEAHELTFAASLRTRRRWQIADRAIAAQCDLRPDKGGGNRNAEL